MEYQNKLERELKALKLLSVIILVRYGNRKGKRETKYAYLSRNLIAKNKEGCQDQADASVEKVFCQWNFHIENRKK